MKKICITALLTNCMSLYTFVACADSVPGAFIDEAGKLNVTVSSDTQKETLFTIYVTEKDTVLTDKLGENDAVGIKGVEQINILPAQKKYSYGSVTSTISSLVPGTQYKVIIGGSDLNGKEIFTVYPSDFDTALAELKGSDTNTVYTVLEKWQNKAWSLELDNSALVQNKSETAKNLVSILKNVSDAKGLYTGFTNAHQLALLSVCDKKDVYTNLLKNEYNFGFGYSDYILKENENILDAFVNLRTDSILNPLTNTDELKLVLRRAEAIGILNEATRENVLDVLRNYNDVFGLDFNGNYLKADSYEVAKAMTPGSTPYTSVKSVCDKFEKATEIDDTAHNGGDSYSSGGSRGSGGSSGVSSGVINPNIIKNANPTEQFQDINEAPWAVVYIQYMQDRKIISGDGNGRVRPNDEITREEFLKILLEALKPSVPEDADEVQAFSDVGESDWYARYVHDAVSLGIVNGMGENRFGAGEKISRQDAAVIINRASEIMKLILKSNVEEISFADRDNISDYAVSAVKTLSMAEIISGYADGSFAPRNPVTRAEAAKLIYSLLKHTGRL